MGKCHVLQHLTLDEDILDPFADDHTEHLATDYPALMLPVVRLPCLNCWDEAPFKLKLCLQCGPDGHALFSVYYGMAHNEFRPGSANLQHNLAAIMDMDIFPQAVASADTLEVERDLGAVTPETRQHVFQTFSSLRTLRPKGA
ncbi:hypothetical protein V8D89_006984 [Ganoderma adspersum]